MQVTMYTVFILLYGWFSLGLFYKHYLDKCEYASIIIPIS